MPEQKKLDDNDAKINFNNIREIFARHVEQWVEMIPKNERSQAFIASADGEDVVSPNDILRQVKDPKSKEGARFLEHVIALAATQIIK